MLIFIDVIARCKNKILCIGKQNEAVSFLSLRNSCDYVTEVSDFFVYTNKQNRRDLSCQKEKQK